jgi:hypothetical protein
MNVRNSRFAPLLLVVASLAVPAPGAAQAHVEIEADPIAYAFNGYSLHLAKVMGRVRVNVGTFGLDIPAAYHGNEGWTSSMRGAGVKVDYLGSSIDGVFVGLDGGYMRNRYALRAGGEAAERDVIGLGVRGGYRQAIGRRGLYVAPWVSVGYNFDGEDVVIAGKEFQRRAVSVFPTVHLGWRI